MKFRSDDLHGIMTVFEDRVAMEYPKQFAENISSLRKAGLVPYLTDEGRLAVKGRIEVIDRFRPVLEEKKHAICAELLVEFALDLEAAYCAMMPRPAAQRLVHKAILRFPLKIQTLAAEMLEEIADIRFMADAIAMIDEVFPRELKSKSNNPQGIKG